MKHKFTNLTIASPFFRRTRFFRPEEDDSLFDDPPVDNEDDSLFDTDADDSGDAPDVSDPTANRNTPPAFDPAAITEAIRDGFRSARPEPAQPQKLSAEELAQRMGVWDPSDDEAESLSTIIRDPDATPADRKKAFVALRDKLVTQAVKTSEYAMQQALAQVHAQYAPALGVIQEQRRKAAEASLYGEFPGLKQHKEAVKLVVQEAAVQFQAGTLEVPKNRTFNQFVAEKTFRLLKKVNPSITPDVIKGQPKGSAPRPPATTTSGKGGGVGNTSGKSSIWD